ncbi:MAG: hypothetical protein GY773_17720, partial [Actinomycetia bacterium]|nr:hypothetical protein [Actinomycetes bacterium]
GAAPGTFFALFGAGIVVAMFVVGAPGMTLQSIENAGLINPAPAATLAEVDSPPYMAGSLPPDSRATTLTLRSNLTDDISRIENDLESEAITLDEAFRDLLAVIKETR